MPDLGGVEAAIHFKANVSDLTTKEPAVYIVAIPVDNDKEGLYVKGGMIRIQVLRSNVNDDDLDSAVFGSCSGYFTVYPGYISKQMEPPTFNIRTYFIDWCTLYRDEEYYFVTCRYTRFISGEQADFDWGTIE